MPHPRKGTEFHGEFSSADASAPADEAAARFAIYAAGSASALSSIGATDQFVITDIQLVPAAALTVTVFDGANNAAGAGEIILQGDFAAKENVNPRFETPHYCQPGTFPKVITSGAGVIKGTIRGHIESK
jgi:hypothetical protein